MSKDHFLKLNKQSQPIRDVLDKPAKAPSMAKAASPPKAAVAHKPIGQLQGESLEDFNYMRTAQDKINRKLAPKSVMGKSSPKR